MKDTEILNLWKSYDKKLDQVLTLNQQLTEDVTKMKAKSILAKAKPIKYFALFIGIPWVAFLIILALAGVHSGGIFFPLSFSVIALINLYLLWTSLYHLVLIHQIDHSDSVIIVQEKLAKIKASEFKAVRIAFLQIPFWSTFFLSLDMIASLSAGAWLLFLIPFIGLCFLSIWLYKNIQPENIDRPWMKVLFSGRDWEPVVNAMDLLEQIEEMK